MKMESMISVGTMVLLFLMQLLICDIGFWAGLPRRRQFVLRMAVSLAGWVALSLLSALLPGLLPGNDDYIISHIKEFAYFIAVTFLNALLAFSCFDIPYTSALFTSIGAYSIEHIASRFSYILKACIYGGHPVPIAVSHSVFNFLIPIMFSCGFYFLLIRRRIEDNKVLYRDRKVLIISGVNLFICIALSIFEPSIGSASLEEILVLCSNYGCVILACYLCLLLQVGYFRENTLDEKNRTLTKMLQMEREKQTLSKETIEIINQKCHDLRHQIRMLEQQAPEERKQSLKSISDAIHIYDSLASTGNSSIDLVLMEKKLLCEKYNINFTYLVDGSKFCFMDEADIYAMLGNMLENAMESVEKEPNPEKRIITFLARAKGDMLYISMENYCPQPVTFKDGIPVTSKDEKAFHGFGAQSILHIAESYGGNARFQMENQYFVVEILIPMMGDRKDMTGPTNQNVPEKR